MATVEDRANDETAPRGMQRTLPGSAYLDPEPSASASSSASGASRKTSRPTGRRSSRTTTSATTADPSIRNRARSFRVQARRRPGPGVGRRTEHRDGATTFTFTGTTDRAPFPGLSEEERTRHKGELLYPNLMVSLSPDHVAAFRLWPLDAGHTGSTATSCSTPPRSSVRRSTRVTPSASGTW